MKHYTFEGLRCIFMLAIFCGHLEVYKIPFFQGIGAALGGNLAVTFFFILAGYVAELSFIRKPEQASSYLSWIGKKIWRFYPLHIVTMLCALPFLFLNPTHDTFNLVKIITANVLLIKSLIPSSDYYFSLNGVSWFLCTWLLLTAVSPCLHTFIKDKHKYALLLFVLIRIIISTLAYYIDLLPWFTYISPWFRIFDYLIGMLIAKRYIENNDLPLLKKTWISTLLEIFCILLPIIQIQFCIIKLEIVNFAIALGIFLTFLQEKGMVSKTIRYNYIARLGGYTYIFSLLHQLVIEYVYIAHTRFFPHKTIAIVASLIISVTGTYIIHKILTFLNNYSKKHEDSTSHLSRLP